MKELSQRNITLAALNAWTDMEIIVLAVHSDVDHFNQPHALFKTNISVLGLVRMHIEEVIQLKRQISELVLQKLSRYHIIIENWPLAKFCAPGDISSHNELSEEDWFQAALVLQNDTTVEGTQNKAAMEGTQPSESSPKHPLESSPVTIDTAHPNNTDLQAQPQPDANPCPSGSSQPHGCKCKAPSAEVLNTVFSSNSDGVPVQKKAQKERSDKGKACGPRKKVPADAL
ncbi:hypothetical protein EDB19DRAFT_1833117 [Suillus lakei]|nr:hypothetical protein EDB19DRAFT_1833117 [Suillus lakei]